MRPILLIIILGLVALTAADTTTIAFGSCNRAELPQPLWPLLAAEQPEVFIWLGDIVYADTENPAVMKKKYQAQAAVPAYRSFAARQRILGTWDDHDYGRNNAGKEFPQKVAAQQALLDFLQEPADSPRRRQAGVYASYDIGTAGRLVRIILLDCRYHRDAPGPTADMLGAEQWTWLERQLRDSPAQVHLIGSGIQVLANDHRWERWGQFPAARQRLLDLLTTTAAARPIFLSGDRHIAELSREGELYDLTSSGLTHAYRNFPGEANSRRLGQVVSRRNAGLVRIDWRQRQIILQIRTLQGFPLQQTIPLTAAATSP